MNTDEFNQKSYTVLVADNFHPYEEEFAVLGNFASLDEAVNAAQAIVNACLIRSYKPGMTADELFTRYTDFGEDPFIQQGSSRVEFSGWDYAKTRCRFMCKGQ